MVDPSNTNWLLVINAADFQKGWTQARLKAMLPAANQGSILVTSQYQDFSAFPDAKLLPTPSMSKEAAVEFMLRFAKRNESANELNAVEEISMMLGRIPIALEQAAAYVRTTGVSFKGYLILLHRYGLRVLPASFDHATDYKHSVQTVFKIALEAVRQQSLMARLLLEFVAFPSAESNGLLPLTMLATNPHGPLTNFTEPVRDSALMATEFLSLVRILHNYYLLTADHDGTTIHIQRIVQFATREDMTTKDRQSRIELWSSVLDFFLKGESNSSNWDFIENWIPHARSVAETVVSDGVDGVSSALFLERLSSFPGKQVRYD